MDKNLSKSEKEKVLAKSSQLCEQRKKNKEKKERKTKRKIRKLVAKREKG